MEQGYWKIRKYSLRQWERLLWLRQIGHGARSWRNGRCKRRNNSHRHHSHPIFYQELVEYFHLCMTHLGQGHARLQCWSVYIPNSWDLQSIWPGVRFPGMSVIQHGDILVSKASWRLKDSRMRWFESRRRLGTSPVINKGWVSPGWRADGRGREQVTLPSLN
jgi:hypothetical protein